MREIKWLKIRHRIEQQLTWNDIYIIAQFVHTLCEQRTTTIQCL